TGVAPVSNFSRAAFLKSFAASATRHQTVERIPEDGDRRDACPTRAGQKCGIERTVTYFGKTSVLYTGGENEITAILEGPKRNPPEQIRLRFREPDEHPLASVTLNGKPWKQFEGEWVQLPGDIGSATIVAKFRSP
ncbi:MAG TPA: hypothetical protein VFR76_13945, partial [Verrucomicrobiae bacterium]|nr:hypothetical protein [Verrucomicrobiae bacterium]